MIDIILFLIAILVLISCIIALQDTQKKEIRFLVIPLENNKLLIKFQAHIFFFHHTIDERIVRNKQILEEIIEYAKKDGFDVSIKFKY